MELDSQTLSSFVLGVVVGVLLCVALFLLARRQLRLSNRAQIEQYEQTILDLRQEQAEGRETNRRLRHELAVSTPEHLETTRDELAESKAAVADLHSQLAESAEQLSVRDRSLREARLAIQEIRMQLEEGRFGDASAQSAEYLEHGMDPGQPSAEELSLEQAVRVAPLDDGVVATEVDTPPDSSDSDSTDADSSDSDADSDMGTGTGSADDGDDDPDAEVLVGDAGPGETVA